MESIINLILNSLDDHWAMTLNMTFTLEEIWATRNNAIFNKASVDLHCSVTHIHHKLKEALLALSQPPSPAPLLLLGLGLPLPLDGSRSILMQLYRLPRPPLLSLLEITVVRP